MGSANISSETKYWQNYHSHLCLQCLQIKLKVLGTTALHHMVSGWCSRAGLWFADIPQPLQRYKKRFKMAPVSSDCLCSHVRSYPATSTHKCRELFNMAFVGMSATCLLAFLSNTRLLRHSRTNHGQTAAVAAHFRCCDTGSCGQVPRYTACQGWYCGGPQWQ